MLLRHSALYLVARGLPGLINLAALVLFTRLLAPEDFGRYALVIAGVGLASALIYHWLSLGLLRFLRSEPERQDVFLSTVLAGFVVITVLSAVAGAIAWWMVGDPVWKSLLSLGVMLLWVQSFFEINQELSRSRLSPGLYGAAAVAKAALALGIGWGAALSGWGAHGLVAGMIIGYLLPLVWQAPRNWRGARLRLVDLEIVRKLLAYGMPLTVTFAFGFIVSSSDRFLLAWLIDTDAAGLYSVGYNFTQYTLVILMMVVNLAGYPLAVRALEESGEKAARAQVAKNGRLLLMIACPAAVGMALLAQNISGVFIGAEFSGATAVLIPWIALGVFLSGIKAYHLDLSFQLGKRTVLQIWIVMIAAAVNLTLNLWWIPLFGILGAAYATVVAYLAGAALSWIIGYRVFPVPLPSTGSLKILGATAGMALFLLPIAERSGVWMLVAQISWGTLVYSTILLLLHRDEFRHFRSFGNAWLKGRSL
jgi:O-antigen/teichoic acid export membrane protein